jgi:hypothetical protein
MIGEGIKLEEYREIKPYWMRQFLLYDGKPQRTAYWQGWLGKGCPAQDILNDPRVSFQTYSHVKFCHGYQKNRHIMLVKCTGITVGPARPEWSGNWPGDVFIIKLAAICNE